MDALDTLTIVTSVIFVAIIILVLRVKWDNGPDKFTY